MYDLHLFLSNGSNPAEIGPSCENEENKSLSPSKKKKNLLKALDYGTLGLYGHPVPEGTNRETLSGMIILMHHVEVKIQEDIIVAFSLESLVH